MKHMGTIALKTNRLILRPFKLDDLDYMFSNWVNDSNVTKFLTWQPHGTIDVTKKILSQWVNNYDNPTFYYWAIVRRNDPTHQPIGCISVNSYANNTSMIHFGFCLGTAWQNKGYASESLSAIMEFFFAHVGANRLESYCDPENKSSCKVMKKCCMTLEGTLKKSMSSNQGVTDCNIFAILSDEYSKKRNRIRRGKSDKSSIIASIIDATEIVADVADVAEIVADVVFDFFTNI